MPSSAANEQYYVMTPAAQLATGTLTMPAGAVSGQVVNINSSQRIVALTLNPAAGQSIVTPTTTIPAPPSPGVRYIMDGAGAWHLVG
jgi:hypothetical protein